MAARWVGALLYGAAAAGAAVGALALEGPLQLTQVRETAPLAALLGALLGFGVNSAWPRRPESAAVAGLMTALIGIVLFCIFYLIGGAFIEAFMGRDATQAVKEATSRLAQRLPLAGSLTIGGFVAAGLLMWILAALGRLLFNRRGRSGDDGDPETAGAA